MTRLIACSQVDGVHGEDGRPQLLHGMFLLICFPSGSPRGSPLGRGLAPGSPRHKVLCGAPLGEAIVTLRDVGVLV